MSFSIYTSCALNYLPKARALAESLARHTPSARLTLCLCDQPPSTLDLEAEPFDQIWLPEDLGYDRAWIFEHSVMELCTAVKGRALLRLLDEEPEALHVYLDPDVYLFHDLEPLVAMMEGASIGLVPHILAPETTDAGVQMTEMSVTGHGIYNLGHLVVRPDANGRAFADWWAERLDRYCFDERQRGLFTDQRWVDLAPAIFDGVRILREPGLDVASWNLSNRDIQAAGPASFTANGRPLITYHFSGTGPTGTHRRVREAFAPCNGAIAEIERLYEAAIHNHGQAAFSGVSPAYDHFDSGDPITAPARRLYRDHGDLRRAFPDPFADLSEAMTYQKWLQEHRPTMVLGLRLHPERLEQAYHDLFDEEYYLERYPEVKEKIASGQYRSALDHYEKIGSHLLLDPNEYFIASYYLQRAEAAGTSSLACPGNARETTLLWHYLACGLAAGAEPVEFFDSGWYLSQNTDLECALRCGQISSPLGHFLSYGSQEGREPGPAFATAPYLAADPKAAELAAKSGVKGAFGAFVRLGNVAGRPLSELTS